MTELQRDTLFQKLADAASLMNWLLASLLFFFVTRDGCDPMFRLWKPCDSAHAGRRVLHNGRVLRCVEVDGAHGYVVEPAELRP